MKLAVASLVLIAMAALCGASRACWANHHRLASVILWAIALGIGLDIGLWLMSEPRNG